jgi:hypothetical protein
VLNLEAFESVERIETSWAYGLNIRNIFERAKSITLLSKANSTELT